MEYLITLKGSEFMSDNSCFDSILCSWRTIPYAGMTTPPIPVEESAATWPLFFFYRDAKGHFFTLNGQSISFHISCPYSFDFLGNELKIVKETLSNLTANQINTAKYWGFGPPTNQFTPIFDTLINTYKVGPVSASRISSILYAAINDTCIITWFYKYLWLVPRPNQLDLNLATLICTPSFPTYPAGHATVAGCVERLLTYFFPGEKQRIHSLCEECCISRLYAGVHFPIDLTQGLQLGQQIGDIIVAQLKTEKDGLCHTIDKPYTTNLHANLAPPPYNYPQYPPCPSKILP